MNNYHCKCAIEYNVTASTLRRNPLLTESLLKNFLLSSLLIGDACQPPNFEGMLDTVWNLMRFQSSCDLEMQYLLTRLELIKVLMGCAIYDVDRSDSISEANSRSVLTTKLDAETQAQQTGHSAGYSDLIGEQRYNDFAESTLRAESQRSAYSESHDESHQRMDDVGHGEAVSDTHGERKSESERMTRDESQSESHSDRSGVRRGLNYNHSAQRTSGAGINLGLVGYNRTPTKSTWDQRMRSDTADSGFSTVDGNSERELDAAASSQSTTQRVSSSFFCAMVDERIWGASKSAAEDHQRAQSDSISHAEGLGQSATEQEARSQGSAQGTSQGQSISITERDGSRDSYTIADTVYAHQRFEALKQLYDHTLQLVTYRRRILSARHGYGIALINFCDKCGYLPDFGSPMIWRLCKPPEPHCPDCEPKIPIINFKGCETNATTTT